MYAMTYTRPDIAFAVRRLSSFTQNPGPFHWNVVRRVLRYLKGTKDYGSYYHRDPLVLEGHSDATWASNKEVQVNGCLWSEEVPYHGLLRNKHVLQTL